MSEDPFSQEYYALFNSVADYDKRLLTVKGWGVTVSLAALGLGFQNQHYGLFLVAAVSGLAFWALEGVMKRFQMAFYVRMREIEVINYELRCQGVSSTFNFYSTPQIDWSWYLAGDYFTGKRTGPPPPPERYTRKEGLFSKWGITSPWSFYQVP